MDEIADTLTNDPSNVTPLITGLFKIVLPLDIPCLQNDIDNLSSKKAAAKSTADTAVTKHTNLKAEATEKYNKANEEIMSLNTQIAAQGGSTIATTTTLPPPLPPEEVSSLPCFSPV